MCTVWKSDKFGLIFLKQFFVAIVSLVLVANEYVQPSIVTFVTVVGTVKLVKTVTVMTGLVTGREALKAQMLLPKSFKTLPHRHFGKNLTREIVDKVLALVRNGRHMVILPTNSTTVTGIPGMVG